MKLGGKISLLAIFAACAALGAVAAVLPGFFAHRHAAHQLPEAENAAPSGLSLYQLESKWTDDAGNPVSLRDFAGQPAVAAMVYTSCEYACPLIVGDMMKIYNGLPENERGGVRFLLVSFDPARDTPETMGRYKKKNLPANGWTVISSDEDGALEFAAALGVRYKPVSGGDFAHSNIVVILDGEGREIFRQSGLGNSPGKAIAALRADA
ncbi:MAG: SCO family protein [Gammaproteobacteria bacterium]